MFGNKPRTEAALDRINDRVDTIIGAGTVFVGDIHVKGTLRIDGRVEGKIECSGDVVIGEGGVAETAVQARNLKVAGVLKGNATASGVLEITDTGKLFGDIEVGKLVISDGALFQGQCTMKVEAPPYPEKKD
ncbi:MAG: polymer-forming cytoskeletal protein [Bacillota bacterium]|nr:polymer-forming cytoskeletal protein [Bacillota bacterium]